MHLKKDDIGPFLDGELDDQRRVEMETHLANCPPCRQQVQEASTRKDQIAARLALLEPGIDEARLDARDAHRLVEVRARKEQQKMWLKRIFEPRTRPVTILAILLLILVAAFAFPQVRAAANNFLGLFRVQQIAIVEINPANLPDQLGASRSFEQALSENITFTERGEPVIVEDKASASTESGLAVRLPESAGTPVKLMVQPGADISFDVDLQRVMDLLREAGYTNLELPQDLDGETVSMNVPPSVMASYGQCEYSALDDPDIDPGAHSLEDCTVLVQMNSPTISAPEGLNLAAIGSAFLQIMGLSEEEAEQFSQTVDWTTTLVIPLPREGVTYRDVQVDGVTGTLIYQGEAYRRPNYMLIWVKDDVVYALSGPGRGDDGLRYANAMK